MNSHLRTPFHLWLKHTHTITFCFMLLSYFILFFSFSWWERLQNVCALQFSIRNQNAFLLKISLSLSLPSFLTHPFSPALTQIKITLINLQFIPLYHFKKSGEINVFVINFQSWKRERERESKRKVLTPHQMIRIPDYGTLFYYGCFFLFNWIYICRATSTSNNNLQLLL